MAGFSVLSVNQVSASEQLFQCVIKDGDGNFYETCAEPKYLESGKENPKFKSAPFAFMIIGGAAKEAQDYLYRRKNKYRGDTWLKQKKGDKDAGKPLTAEDEAEVILDYTCMFVKGWVGATETFSEELLRTVLKANPTWVQQLNFDHENVSNFLPSR